jgi:hypothetical protein
MRSHGCGHLSQRRDIVHHPERAAVRCKDQIVAMHGDVANRGDRKVELQRLPCGTIVERNVDAELRSGVEQAASLWILANGVDERPVGNALCDCGPGRAAVARSVNVRRVIVEPVTVDGSVGGCAIEV